MTDSTPKLIPLYRRTELIAYAIVDADDYDKVADMPWVLTKNGYAQCRSKKYDHAEYMHRLIAQAPEGTVVDHKNHNRLDNRKANLRGCTVAQNSANARRFRGRHGFRGIWKHNKNGTWRASLTVNGEAYMMSGFTTPEEAARVYDALAHHFHGEFAILNFPEEAPTMPEGLLEQIKQRKKAWGNRAVTETQMQTIREERAKGRHVDDLAAEFGLNRSTVYRIIKGVGYQ